ncbi:hypothetical protein ACLB2K_062943 [Fragaria x ananassa]
MASFSAMSLSSLDFKTKNIDPSMLLIPPPTNSGLFSLPPSGMTSPGLLLCATLWVHHPHYKVLCVTNDDEDDNDGGGHHDIEIYSSETGEWKHLKTPYFPRERAMHFGYFGECGGRLYLIETYDHCLTQFDVMEMERDYSGWFVKYQVGLNPLVAAFPGQDCNALVVLCLSQEEETDYGVEDTSTHLLLHLSGSGKVISYNLRSKIFRTSVELVNKELALGYKIEFGMYSAPPFHEARCPE